MPKKKNAEREESRQNLIMLRRDQERLAQLINMGYGIRRALRIGPNNPHEGGAGSLERALPWAAAYALRAALEAAHTECMSVLSRYGIDPARIAASGQRPDIPDEVMSAIDVTGTLAPEKLQHIETDVLAKIVSGLFARNAWLEARHGRVEDDLATLGAKARQALGECAEAVKTLSEISLERIGNTVAEIPREILDRLVGLPTAMVLAAFSEKAQCQPEVQAVFNGGEGVIHAFPDIKLYRVVSVSGVVVAVTASRPYLKKFSSNMEFNNGILYAVSVMLATGRSPVDAANVLRQSGLADADCSHLAAFEKAQLKPLNQEDGISLKGI